MDFKTDFEQKIVDLKDGYIKDIQLYQDLDLDHSYETYHLDVTFIVTTNKGKDRELLLTVTDYDEININKIKLVLFLQHNQDIFATLTIDEFEEQLKKFSLFMSVKSKEIYMSLCSDGNDL